MSTATVPSPRPARPAPPQSPARPAGASLRLVPARRTSAPRTPFVAVVVVLLAGGLLGLLGLNTLLAQDSFRLHALAAEGRALAEREQVLQREVEALRTPASLAARAEALGMVPAGPPAFLRLSDGAVLGAEVAATAPPPPPAPEPADAAADDASTAAAEGDATAADGAAAAGGTDDAAAGNPAADQAGAGATDAVDETARAADAAEAAVVAENAVPAPGTAAP